MSNQNTVLVRAQKKALNQLIKKKVKRFSNELSQLGRELLADYETFDPDFDKIKIFQDELQLIQEISEKVHRLNLNLNGIQLLGI